MWLKTGVKKEVANVVRGYTPRAGCNAEEKDNFWSLLGGFMMEIPETAMMWIGADLNEHV